MILVFYLRFCLFLSIIILLAESALGHKSLFVWSSVRPLLRNPLWAPPLAEPKFLGALFVLVRTPCLHTRLVCDTLAPIYVGHNTHYGRNTQKKTKINQVARVAELQYNTRTRCEIYNSRKFSTFEYRNRKGPSVKAEHFDHIFLINPERITIRFSLTLTPWVDAQLKFTINGYFWV